MRNHLISWKSYLWRNLTFYIFRLKESSKQLRTGNLLNIDWIIQWRVVIQICMRRRCLLVESKHHWPSQWQHVKTHDLDLMSLQTRQYIKSKRKIMLPPLQVQEPRGRFAARHHRRLIPEAHLLRRKGKWPGTLYSITIKPISSHCAVILNLIGSCRRLDTAIRLSVQPVLCPWSEWSFPCRFLKRKLKEASPPTSSAPPSITISAHSECWWTPSRRSATCPSAPILT